jgi:hypothetical protein
MEKGSGKDLERSIPITIFFFLLLFYFFFSFFLFFSFLFFSFLFFFSPPSNEVHLYHLQRVLKDSIRLEAIEAGRWEPRWPVEDHRVGRREEKGGIDICLK